MGPRLERERDHGHDQPVEEDICEDRDADCGQDKGLRGAQSQQSRGRGALVNAGRKKVVDAAHRGFLAQREAGCVQV